MSIQSKSTSAVFLRTSCNFDYFMFMQDFVVWRCISHSPSMGQWVSLGFQFLSLSPNYLSYLSRRKSYPQSPKFSGRIHSISSNAIEQNRDHFVRISKLESVKSTLSLFSHQSFVLSFSRMMVCTHLARLCGEVG